jgi:hypothetical protein
METPQAKGYIEKEEREKSFVGIPKVQPRCKNEH